MKLSIDGLREVGGWEAVDISLPKYDVLKLQEKTRENPKWAHFGIGNIFRIFLGDLAEKLIEEGDMDTGISCIETYDFDIVDKIFTPYDNLALTVTLGKDGTMEKKVIGALAQSVRGDSSCASDWNRLKEIFCNKELQMVSFTITEKGYALCDTSGEYLPYIAKDIENEPNKATSLIAIVTAMLFERFQDNKAPISLVSMDNVSKNGSVLKSSVVTVAEEWVKRGFVTADFIDYLNSDKSVAFPWTMIDKITPRPADFVYDKLTADGVLDMDIVVTEKSTYIAPFVNAEGPQYLVIEDSFPNGRPPLERVGVYMTDRNTVNMTEKMKVTACLNPIHTALAPYGRLLRYEYFADLMSDPELKKLADRVGYDEGLPRVEDPGIFSPKAFLDEVINERFPNKYLGDTNARICTDSSQGVSVRFGETIKSYYDEFGTAENLEAIPLAIAGWLRYFYAIDDEGNSYELSPDPLAETLHKIVSSLPIGNPEAYENQLYPILSNKEIFGCDLYEVGVGKKIEKLFLAQISAFGAVRKTLVSNLK